MGILNKSGDATLFSQAFPLVVVLTSLIHTCLAPSQRPLRAALFTEPLWMLRGYHSTFFTDIAIVLAIGAYFCGTSDLEPPRWILETRLMELQIFACLVLLMTLAGLIVLRGEAPPRRATSGLTDGAKRQLLPPLLLPGRTTHSRMFPEKHSFEYSYFSVGVPVDFKGRVRSMLSANLDLLGPEERHKGWFNIDASDYLYRGGPERGLEERLRRYLREEGVPDEAWSFAYLVTAPKFLGYSFNPVSFWYIYDSSDHLNMMVLEVNNTFGERRLYLLKAEGKASSDDLPDGFEAPAKSTKFTNAWVKDFHVSPFNSRKGSYSLAAADPVAALKSGSKVLNNLIVLNSSKSHAKLVARVFSEGDHMDPASMSTLQMTRLLASWFWVGFATFPRIIAQAYKLYFKRKLHVWFRPEVLATSIGRAHTTSEAILEAFFRAYLASLFENAGVPLQLTYVPAGGLGDGITMSRGEKPKELVLRVLSPGFYTRFAHYAHTTEAFDREGLCTDSKNRTMAIENAENLPLLLSSSTSSKSRVQILSRLEQYRWTLLTKLRSPPPAPAYPDSEPFNHDTHTIQDIRVLPPSPLDRFAMSFSNDETYKDMIHKHLHHTNPSIIRDYDDLSSLYRRTVTKVFIADRWFMGFEGLVDALDFTFRVALVVLWFYLAIRTDVRVATMRLEDNVPIVLGFRVGRWMMKNLVHFWAAVKGA